MNTSIYSKKALAFSSLFFLICSVSNASDFDVRYSKLSTKQKTLIHECSAIYQAAMISNFWFSEYPEPTQSSSSSVNAWARLEVANWNSKYGMATGTVLSIYIDAKNRFGETTTKRVMCGWRKGDYEMLFPSYWTDINGNKVLMEMTER
ncbi:hypothetical protein LP416_21130 [Polaromonas sp. P2-4]|nr:hypothetical protein LP416_21130 [Polaromonas sp. P2-4]